ncbi:heterokaryon incompatibility protein-domain-containing protein [Achaetomium macrosporum]|uniref:Heterokaryon incompatibility protein-domain-containing protein n=1 Tax=Achaetomium macrosporum TaxID=79813 RepID=A0AAN7H7X2_9PEZI|nr:heterokaryon incompatibility protein-domain-containing protein [Achaetomium macrosporum]
MAYFYGTWCRLTKDKVYHIRLLRLAPGAYHDPSLGDLVEVSLAEVRGTYIALSYLFIDDKQLMIGANLNAALRQLRSETSATTAWVDAVCINQHDNVERNFQVRLMAEIYESVAMVFSWLGEATGDSATGIEVLNFLAGDCPFDNTSPWNCMPAQELILGLEDILQRTYFQRIWIVQEAAPGRRVRLQVGGLSVEWDAAKDARRFLARIKLLEVSPAWQAGWHLGSVDFRPLRELLEQAVAARARKGGAGTDGPQTVALLDVVHALHMQSTDPRDKIFGLMGLAQPGEVAGFVPDYSGTWEWTYQRLFHHVSRTVMQNPEETWNEDPYRKGEDNWVV